MFVGRNKMSCHYRHVSVAKRCCQWSEQQFFVLFACDCQGHLACNHHHPHLKSADHVTNADVNGITKHSPIWLTLPTFQWCPYKPVLVTRCSFQSPNEHLECETTPSPPSFPYLSDRAEACDRRAVCQSPNTCPIWNSAALDLTCVYISLIFEAWLLK